MEINPLARIDSFPYRHRLREVMSSPVLTGPEGLVLADAVRLMYEAHSSSIVGVGASGKAIGIFTERDLLRVLSDGGKGLQSTLGEALSRPVMTVAAESYVYVALARMTRFGLRHLVVVDGKGRPVGMVTGRALLKVRATEALVLGDAIQDAAGPAEMKALLGRLPSLAWRLLDDGVEAIDIASVISLVLRDLTARAAELAEQAMMAEGLGGAPAPYAVLVLGSGGRGESLLSFDQDNAIVHRGGEADSAWFLELGRRLSRSLNEAGIPLCKGKVMASEPEWNRSLDAWGEAVRTWVFAVEDQSVLNCDIFFDFQPVRGDEDLAAELRRTAVDMASQSPFFLGYLSQHVARMDIPLGLMGWFITEKGRMDIKKAGLLPLVSTARLRAIRAGIGATGTDDRFAALQEAGQMHDDDLRDLTTVRATLLDIMLRQQLRDIEDGLKPSSRIDPTQLDRAAADRLRWALKRLKTLRQMCGLPG
ncbi:MAG: DUF294 nucleotidyltransferase-like domain-containing protein [Magnetospirillum sp. WYHS-4]